MPASKQDEVAKLIIDSLPNKEGARVMKTIADKYIDEGVEKGIQLGHQSGLQEGAQTKSVEIATNMLRQNLDQSLIANVTGLSADEITKLQSKTHFTA